MGKVSDDIEPVISHPPTTTDGYGGGAGGAFSGSGGPTSGPRAGEAPDVNTYTEGIGRRASSASLLLSIAGVVIVAAVLVWVFASML